MKRTLLVFLVAALAVFFAMPRDAAAQGTAFTYQGNLNNNGSPANGNFDFIFILFNVNQFGFPVGPQLTNTNVRVANGMFTATLDFGSGIFTGTNLWLDISVRANGGGVFQDLTPRQPINPAPYAVFATGASNAVNAITAANLSGNVSDAQLSANIPRLNSSANFSGTVTAGSFSGNGINLSNVNAQTLTGQTAANFWQLAGNNISIGQFFGSANNQPVEFRAGNVRALRLEPAVATNGAPNVIGGSSANNVTPGIVGATIGGGGATNYLNVAYTNSVSMIFGTVSGGRNNTASGDSATVGGGFLNTASSDSTTVGGGFNNAATNGSTTVSGGFNNLAGGNVSTVGGGGNNTASGDYGTLAGGRQNSVSGSYATVSGGYGNITSGLSSTVSGGGNIPFFFASSGNIASGDYSSVGGGLANNASGTGSAISGGSGNQAANTYATVGGGQNNQAFGDHSTIGGGSNNIVTNLFATISGGQSNLASGPNSSIGGGEYNQATGSAASIGGGNRNLAQGIVAVVAGGVNHTAFGDYDTIGGGFHNSTEGEGATIGGGIQNFAIGGGSTIPGGEDNETVGADSFAAGVNATAEGDGSFCWSDGTAATTANVKGEFVARASGGVVFFTSSGSAGAILPAGSGSWSSLSDRNAKENFKTVDAQLVLAAVTAMPLTTWNYKTQDPSIRHLGPMAQDFQSAFDLGENNTTISTVDEGGVALAAIQGLSKKLESKQVEIEKQASEIAELKTRLEKLEQLIDQTSSDPQK